MRLIAVAALIKTSSLLTPTATRPRTHKGGRKQTPSAQKDKANHSAKCKGRRGNGPLELAIA
jgi:hypothetical protein